MRNVLECKVTIWKKRLNNEQLESEVISIYAGAIWV